MKRKLKIVNKLTCYHNIVIMLYSRFEAHQKLVVTHRIITFDMIIIFAKTFYGRFTYTTDRKLCMKLVFMNKLN